MGLAFGFPGLDEARLGALFGPGVSVGCADPRAPASDLWPEEAAALHQAVSRRRGEFAAGRRAARGALAALGRAACAIPVAPTRAPLWPAGIIGSISHCDRIAVAAVAPAGRFRALGLDVEPDEPLPEGLGETICRPEEMHWIARAPQQVQGRLGRLIFSAKEALFKAQFPLTGVWLDFADIALRLHHGAVATAASGAGAFTARLTRAAGGFAPGHVFEGKFATSGGFVLTAVTIPVARAAITGE